MAYIHKPGLWEECTHRGSLTAPIGTLVRDLPWSNDYITRRLSDFIKPPEDAAEALAGEIRKTHGTNVPVGEISRSGSGRDEQMLYAQQARLWVVRMGEKRCRPRQHRQLTQTYNALHGGNGSACDGLPTAALAGVQSIGPHRAKAPILEYAISIGGTAAECAGGDFTLYAVGL